MEKVYIIFYNNGEEYPEEYEEFIYPYYFLTREDALQKIEELKNNNNFMKNICRNYEEKSEEEKDMMFMMSLLKLYKKEK